MTAFVLELLKFQLQLKILHWQTKSYSKHMAFGEAYDSLNDLIDNIVELIQGKYSRIKLGSESSVVLADIANVNLRSFVSNFITYLNNISIKDTDILNKRDEIIAVARKLSYLLTFK